jgi:hypothetical protein
LLFFHFSFILISFDRLLLLLSSSSLFLLFNHNDLTGFQRVRISFYARCSAICQWHEWIQSVSVSTQLSVLDKESCMSNRATCFDLH